MDYSDLKPGDVFRHTYLGAGQPVTIIAVSNIKNGEYGLRFFDLWASDDKIDNNYALDNHKHWRFEEFLYNCSTSTHLEEFHRRYPEYAV